MNSFQFIAKYIKRHRFQYAAGIITLFVVDFANLFIPKLTGSITDGLTAHTFTWDDVKLCLLYNAVAVCISVQDCKSFGNACFGNVVFDFHSLYNLRLQQMMKSCLYHLFLQVYLK